jgi:hypothetical protein
MDTYIEVEVRFLSTEEGGRNQLPGLKSGTYRPHLRVSPDSPLLGVEFVDGPETFQPNLLLQATLRLTYTPLVDYSMLTIGTRFDVVEGPKVVASGVVMASRRFSPHEGS